MEIPYTGRAVLKDTFQGLEITIPTKKNWFIILFLCIWLSGWFMGETAVLGSVTRVFKEANFAGLFMLFWLCGWTLGGAWALTNLIWNLNGREILNFEQGQLVIQKKGLLFFKPRTYNLIDAKNFRVQDDKFGYGGARRTGLAPMYDGGTIRFDYGLKTVKIAGGIDEPEAKLILDKLKSKKILSEINF